MENTLSEIWRATPPKYKKTLDGFWSHLGKSYPDFKVSYGEMRQKLINLGLHTPRGPKIKNHGGVKIHFDPHAIWEGDGKQVNITINGIRHRFLWYAFVDQSTTLLVGANIDRTETAENFLRALKDAGGRNDLYAMALLIDNRLSDSDLSPIKAFLREHNITLIRTFPGNSKSNGTIEGNFSLFEKYVGDIDICGKNTEQIAASVAKNLVEVFTQLRNHQPRRRLNGETPSDFSQNTQRPEHLKSEVEKLAARLGRETADIEQKWQLLGEARECFENMTEEQSDKMKRQLKYYSIAILLDAQAAYLVKVKSHDGGYYGSAYFMGILRNKQEARAKEIYNAAFRAGIEKAGILLSPAPHDKEECARIITEEIEKAQNLPSPSHSLLHLEAVAWSLVHYKGRASLTDLWLAIEDRVRRSFKISFQFWQQVSQYLFGRVGVFLYKEPIPI